MAKITKISELMAELAEYIRGMRKLPTYLGRSVLAKLVIDPLGIM